MVTPPKYLNDPFEFSAIISCKDPKTHARQMLDGMCQSSDYFNSHRADFPNVSTFEQFRSELKKDELGRLRQFEELIRQTDSNTQTNLLNFLSESFGVISFAGSGVDQLMWAHYATDHAGFSIEFREGHILFSGRSFLRVNYSDDPIIYDASASPNRDQAELFLKRKGTDWKHEQECRLVVDLKFAVPSNTAKGSRYFLPIAPDVITSVTLGLRRPESLRIRVVEALANPSFKHVQLFQIAQDSKKTKLDRVAI